MKIYLIRHGKTIGNSQGRYIGKTDESLSDEGKKEIQRFTNLKKYPNPKKYPNLNEIYVSPMKRCIETASIIFPKAKQIQVSNLREMDFGDFENKNYSDLNGNEDYQKWIDSNGKIPFPNGESQKEFINRIKSGFCCVLNNFLEKKDTTLEKDDLCIVAHGGTIMAILNSIIGEGYYEYRVKNGRGFVVNFNIEKYIEDKILEGDIEDKI